MKKVISLFVALIIMQHAFAMKPLTQDQKKNLLKEHQLESYLKAVTKTLKKEKPKFSVKQQNNQSIFYTTKNLPFYSEWGFGTLSGIKIIKDSKGNIVSLDAMTTEQGPFGGQFRRSFLRITTKNLKANPKLKKQMDRLLLKTVLPKQEVGKIHEKLRELLKKKKLPDIEIITLKK